MTQYQGTTKELFSGLLHKCGGKVKSWNKRFFILKDDFCLYYYKDTAKGHLGAISLRDTKFSVRKGEPGDVSWPRGVDLKTTFAVVTNQRTYCMYAGSQDEAETWVRMLQGAREKLVESLETNKLLNKRSQSTSVIASGAVSNDHRTLSDPHHPNSPAALDVPRTSNGVERQLTYEEMNPLPSESLTSEGPNSFYDMAKPEDEVFVDHQVYEDIESKPKPSTEQPSEPEALYDEASAVLEDSPGGLYEEVAPETSIQSQPLPPIPTESAVGTTTGDALYEDIGQGPLYEAVSESNRDRVNEIEERVDFTPPPREEIGGPALPPKDTPPLPPRDNGHMEQAPALPPRNGESPALPLKNDSPPLPSKDLPAMAPKRDDSPPLPPKDSPGLPPKRDDSPASFNKNPSPPLPAKGSPASPIDGDLPPLPPKQDEDYYDDVAEVMNSVNKMQLSELENGSPPSQRKQNGYHTEDEASTPPSHHTSTHSTSPSYHTTPSQHTPSTAGTPPTPRKRTPPPSPRLSPKPRLPDKPVHLSDSPPSPRRTTPTERTPPSPGMTIPTERTPPSLHKTTPHDHTPPRSPKPSPTPRRKAMNLPPEPAPRSAPKRQDSTDVKSPISPDRGRDLFRSRQERLEELSAVESTRRADTVQLITSDPSLSSREKVTFAQTLREVEQEKLMASEEKFKWERERMKFEEERRKFEEERRQLQEQLAAAKKQIGKDST